MPDWLSNIGRGIKRGVQALPRPEMLDEEAVLRTPGFNPNAQMPQQGQRPGALVRLARPEQTMPQQINAATDYDPLPTAIEPRGFNPPITGQTMQENGSPMPSALPRPGAMPQMAAPSPMTRDRGVMAGAPDAAALPRPMAPPVMTGAPEIAPPTLPRPTMTPNDDRRNVPIPRLPGQTGDPYAGTDYDRAKYDAQMKGRMVDGSPGSFDANGQAVDNKPAGIGWKRGLQHAMIGAGDAYNRNPRGGLASMAGGALAYGIGGKVNPDAARGNLFDAGQGRQMLEQQGRQQQQQQQQGALNKQQAEIERIQAQTGLYGAQGQAATVNADRQAAVAQSTIKLNAARAEAARRGTPQKADIYNPENDQIETVMVYPDGRQVSLGASGAAKTAADNRAAQMERAKLTRGSIESEGDANREVRERTAAGRAQSRAQSVPPEARTEHTRVQGLLKQAESLRRRWQLEADPDRKAALESAADQAFQDYNDEAEAFGEAFGDYYDVGPDETGKTSGVVVRPKAMPGRTGSANGKTSPRNLDDLMRLFDR